MLNLFRVVGVIEGISYLLLVFIAVPIKYINGNPEYVKLLGMPHGILFIAYLVLAFVVGKELKWNSKLFGLVFLSAIIPFGTFYFDYNYLRPRSNG